MAAFVGVAATGAVIARDQRQRRAYTPEQVRDRLRERAAQAGAAGTDEAAGTAVESGEDLGVPVWRRRLSGLAAGVRRSAAAALGLVRGRVDRSV
ncbi:hypothetical protein [Nocardiopsis dassonvillei]|uniref:Uncharacterized protein n=1 Tax=Nocardiopsis dassonvillei (strain ATCC 23218 / DSM 43111 / CIP 107115 / JCM 7437 / KCTC 9190 / NBRC 14626 / NCTC 10488 / NRRL B-5397 / IMRU 509) TaxID=446468 RepID=D7AVN1_NOCDD|nr:hypothetical protein [Nocardiopsis dassonvillei]ADH67720.1 conserved hypothetical protein [Nocardiopsis dassonvillei subsp. dassonvillei DSM 43111]APC35896.1 hypothetical protein A9R04_14920 [Nocardiopsis dassonvillei]NKY80118.1 hypothetical protein [Nocardiopsis dassonvillei]VEI88142.1 Uncharacterised protein [Nocardiopsis dassonvillei]